MDQDCALFNLAEDQFFSRPLFEQHPDHLLLFRDVINHRWIISIVSVWDTGQVFHGFRWLDILETERDICVELFLRNHFVFFF